MLKEIGQEVIHHPNESIFSRIENLSLKQNQLAALRKCRDYALIHQTDQFRSTLYSLKPEDIELVIVPGRFLPVVCSVNAEGKVGPTAFGEIIKAMHQKMTEMDIESFFILTPGAAQEAIPGAKPFTKTRSDRNGSIVPKFYEITESSPPMIDGDLVLVLNSPHPIKTVIPYLIKYVSGIGDLQIKSYTSNSRGTTRLEVGKLITGRDWRRFWFSAGHINVIDPEFSGRFCTTLAEFICSRDSNQNYILLTPTSTPEGFIGTKIDFFAEWRNLPKIYFWQRNHEGKLVQRSIRPTIIPSFEKAFPTDKSFPEAFALFMHLLKSITWENCLPILGENYPLGILGEEEVKKISRKTAFRFGTEIIYRVTKESSLVVKNPTTMRETTNRLLNSIRQMLNGDPYLGFVYLGQAGECIRDLPTFGFGLIDPNGFFPNIYNFLQLGNRHQRLMAEMEVCDYGIAQTGWSTFVRFLYRETGHDLIATTNLLTPSFLSKQIYPTLVENYVRRSLENVPRLGLKLEKPNYLPSWTVEPTSF